ncbi:MAG: long-chain fatty acid--CoA ligase [Alphaproteobacteria bacterium]|nr:long-chain fatty acid--CoA ligase [Alphaproteobacteria bacterium]
MSQQELDGTLTGAPPGGGGLADYRPPSMAEAAGWASERNMRQIEETPLPTNIGTLLRTAAVETPDRPVLVFFDDDETITYGELDRRVDEVTTALSRLGVRRGTRVSIMVFTQSTYPLTWLALARIGAVAQPLNYNYTSRELHFMLTDFGAEFLVIDAELLSVFEGMETAVLPRDRLLVVGDGAQAYPNRWRDIVPLCPAQYRPNREPDLDDLMNVQYTSGTTGLPKGALQTHRFWLTFGRVGAAQFQDRLERILIAQPFYYIDAQWLMLMTIYRRGTAYVARKQSASRFPGWLKTYRINYCNFPEVVSKQPAQPDDAENDMIVASCYSHRRENYPWYERRYGFLARQGFSMTELGCALYVPMEAGAMTGTGTVGIPVAFREAKIMDAEGFEVPRGAVGELCVRTKSGLLPRSILQGYHNRPEATRDAFHEGGWFRTGDAARQDEAGWFFYLGRRKDMVRRNSENISAVEVEGVLRGMVEILEAAVLPVPDELRGEEVKAYLLLAEGKTPADCPPPVVFAHCERLLARFKIPRYLEYVAEFPRTPSLKIKKSALIAAKPDLCAGSYDRVEGRWR